MTTIQNVVSKYTDSIKLQLPSANPVDKSQCNWNKEDGVNTKLLQTVKNLLWEVNNCELAVACSNWVVKSLPMGELGVFSIFHF